MLLISKHLTILQCARLSRCPAPEKSPGLRQQPWLPRLGHHYCISKPRSTLTRPLTCWMKDLAVKALGDHCSRKAATSPRSNTFQHIHCNIIQSQQLRRLKFDAQDFGLRTTWQIFSSFSWTLVYLLKTRVLSWKELERDKRATSQRWSTSSFVRLHNHLIFNELTKRDKWDHEFFSARPRLY